MQIKRKKEGAVIGGVCAGLAEHMGADVTLVRLGFLLSLFLGSLGGWVYLILWLLMPQED